ncbi:ThuA domain-containing protein [Lederbergia citrea]|uniref:ThuA domain-containing protein n=1 Tax=Lederbergia citrea TaxID=2833581 RepID=A0A942UR36_9BACI|nr:ThuA domain-containing protein [Lederbergia citrea]MBS4205949.1 ThuA domain-containing protein [Lederbergia citrea]MBS4224602.1 ThuA domain-containing protein [Lederbergia citrea]
MSKRVIAFVGDFYHKKEWAVASLNKALESVPEVSVEYLSAENMIEHLRSNPDSVILFKENRLNPQDDEIKTWMDDEVASAISEYVKEGGCWIAWHSGLASYENITEYTSLLKGYFEHHPDKHQVVTYISEPGTDIIDHHVQFEILDEHYFVYCDEDNTNVFLKSKSVDGSSIAGWTHEYGHGRVVCLTPAHLEEGLLHPIFIELLTNSIKIGN